MRPRLAAGLPVLLAFATACGGGGTGPSSLAIAARAGQNQIGPAGAPLPTALAVLVTDASGDPVAGREVDWTTTGGSLDPATSTTDATGVASAAWRLGSAGGAQEARATLADGGASAAFTATAQAALPAPPLVATVEVPPNYGAHDTYVRDGVAFLCAWNTGLIILDVGGGGHGGSPTSPVELGRLVTSANGVAGGPQVHNAWWFHNPVSGEKRYVFVGQEGPGSVGTSSQGDIHVVDVSDLTAPQEVAVFHLGPIGGAATGTHNFWMDEQAQILYAAYYNGGVVALDVSGSLAGDLSSRLIANLQPGGAGNTFVWGVQLYNGDLYASDMLSGLWHCGSTGAGGCSPSSRAATTCPIGSAPTSGLQPGSRTPARGGACLAGQTRATRSRCGGSRRPARRRRPTPSALRVRAMWVTTRSRPTAGICSPSPNGGGTRRRASTCTG